MNRCQDHENFIGIPLGTPTTPDSIERLNVFTVEGVPIVTKKLSGIMKDIVPKIDLEEIQKKANEFAQEGVIKTLKDFYTGYNSPYTKAISKEMESKKIPSSFDLPDIVAALNEGISGEIDKITNKAIAESYIPLVRRMLVRAKKEVTFSEILREYIDLSSFDHNYDDWEDFEVVYYDDRYKVGEILYNSFKYLEIRSGEKSHRIGFHNVNNDRNKPASKDDKWTIHSIPDNTKGSPEMMELSQGELTLKIPFARGILRDRFTSYIASMVLSGTLVAFDVDEFNYDMFPEGCHC